MNALSVNVNAAGACPALARHHHIEPLEDRRAPAVVTAVFDFDGFGGNGYTSLEMEDEGITATVTRPGALFDVINSGEGAALSPFGNTDGGAFVINFSQPVKLASVRLGDYGQDDNDKLVLQAFAKPDAEGPAKATSRGTLATLDGDPYNAGNLTVTGEAIMSIRVIGGTARFLNSTFVDHVIVSSDSLDLKTESLAWDAKKGGVAVSYAISGRNLAEGEMAKVELYWASGPTQADTIEKVPYDFKVKTKKGIYKENVPGKLLQQAPEGATHLVLVLDGDAVIEEVLEDNNEKELADVRLDEQQPLGYLSEHSASVLKGFLRVAGEEAATVTSILRTPEDQARIMFDTIVSKGIAYQKTQYKGKPGESVITAFKELADANDWNTKAEWRGNAEALKLEMQMKIEEIGAHLVSDHMAIQSELQAVDLAPSSFSTSSAKSRFVKVAKAAQIEGVLKQFLSPPKDPALHSAIYQV